MRGNPVRGMVLGAVAIVLVGYSMATTTETPPPGYAVMQYVLLGLGALGFLGSLFVYLGKK